MTFLGNLGQRIGGMVGDLGADAQLFGQDMKTLINPTQPRSLGIQRPQMGRTMSTPQPKTLISPVQQLINTRAQQNPKGFIGSVNRNEQALNGNLDQVLGSYEKGGPINKTGLYKLHKGEYVMNKKKAQIAKKMKR